MQGRGYSLCKVGARTGATDCVKIGQGMEEGKSAIHSLVDSNGKGSLHRCREPFLLCGCHCDRLPRRPATSQVYALDCPSVSPQSGIHRFPLERASVTQGPLFLFADGRRRSPVLHRAPLTQY